MLPGKVAVSVVGKALSLAGSLRQFTKVTHTIKQLTGI